MGKTFIIAEAGVNHNGNINLAKELVDVATKACIDAIKFQTFKTEQLICKNAPKAKYQNQLTNRDESQFEMLKKLELNEEAHIELINYTKKKGVMFLSTAFDHDSINFLNKQGMGIFKIPSGEITNYKYLQHIGSLKKKIILSTGMSEMSEIEDALNVISKAGTKKENITVLHATTEYPTPFVDVNLKAMQTIAKRFNVRVGYSDHTLGIEVPIAAVAMGATVIEKHFTLDRNMDGPDHKASLEPDELVKMVTSIRNIESALGKEKKGPSESEKKNMKVARKSLVANTVILKGEIFTEENIAAKRPGTGISPMKWNEIIGQRANKDYKKNDLI